MLYSVLEGCTKFSGLEYLGDSFLSDHGDPVKPTAQQIPTPPTLGSTPEATGCAAKLAANNLS